jgi:hypothetical protein
MGKSIEHQVDRQIDEDLRDLMRSRCASLLTDRRILGTRYASTIRSLNEALSTDDWNRFGVIVALFWAKLDAVISALKSGNDVRVSMNRTMDALATELRAMRARMK